MPLNNFPTAKPTYDFYDTVNVGTTAVANGILKSTTTNPPDTEFPGGSVTYHWHEGSPVANYLVENSVGDFDVSVHKGSDGITYYEVQDSTIPPARQQQNLAIMERQQSITDFEAGFNGPFPFASDGVLVGTPVAAFQEEMESMITFEGGSVNLRTLYHENMHQWWGDNVTESNYNMTFYKEGLATVAQFLADARARETRAGGPGTAAGQAAFNQVLVDHFDTIYSKRGSAWGVAPSDPTPASLFADANTYNRPAAAYLALRQILGPDTFDDALQAIQQQYGGGNIDEAQLEAGFARFLPDRSGACTARLATFFTEWFDTAYPYGGGGSRPQITGPGLDGPGFYDADGGCS
jgi:aminopeptidase N